MKPTTLIRALIIYQLADNIQQHWSITDCCYLPLFCHKCANMKTFVFRNITAEKYAWGNLELLKQQVTFNVSFVKIQNILPPLHVFVTSVC